MAIAIVCAVIWFAFQGREHTSGPEYDRAPAANVEVEASGSTVVDARTQQPPMPPDPDPSSAAGPGVTTTDSANGELPDFQVPLDQAIARLRVLANAGNEDALYQLSSRLADCTARALRANKFSDEMDRRTLEEDKANKEMDEKLRTVRALNGQGRIDRHAAERVACAQLPPEVRENWLDPIDQLAQSGKTYALRQYAAFVVREYDSREAIVADVDRAIVRRDKARAYLHRAVDLGDAEALADLALAYFNHRSGLPQLYAVDNYQAYMYAYAASFGPRAQYRDLDWQMSESARALDAGQIADARKQGKQLYDTCCSRH